MNRFIKNIFVLLLVILLIGCFLFVLKNNKNSTSTSSTFYLIENGQYIRSDSSNNNFNRVYEFNIHYAMSILQEDTSFSYDLSCINNFRFEIYGVEHWFNEVNLDTLFNVSKTDKQLTMDCSKSVYTLLANYYSVNTAAVKIDETSALRDDVIQLTFYSADKSQSIKISGLFGGLKEILPTPTITIEPSEVVF